MSRQYVNLRELLQRPEWFLRAACRGIGPDLFFPDDESPQQTADDARKVCVQCPVREECLDYAVTNAEPVGVWGGVSERDRRRIRRQRKAALIDTTAVEITPKKPRKALPSAPEAKPTRGVKKNAGQSRTTKARNERAS